MYNIKLNHICVVGVHILRDRIERNCVFSMIQHLLCLRACACYNGGQYESKRNAPRTLVRGWSTECSLFPALVCSEEGAKS